MSSENKIYGAVNINGKNLLGFCKRIYDKEIQSVDVFINEKKVDTILSNQNNKIIEDLYDVFDLDGFCFTYNLPDEYDGKECTIAFKNCLGEDLVHSPLKLNAKR